MKTIDERAREYAPDAFMPDEILPAREGHLVNLERRGYIAGATEEHKLLTEWQDPKEPPHDQYEVLAKIDGGYFKVVVFEPSKNLWRVSGTQEWINIISWREIYE